jgi:hypothetical protein
VATAYPAGRAIAIGGAALACIGVGRNRSALGKLLGSIVAKLAGKAAGNRAGDKHGNEKNVKHSFHIRL